MNDNTEKPILQRLLEIIFTNRHERDLVIKVDSNSHVNVKAKNDNVIPFEPKASKNGSINIWRCGACPCKVFYIREDLTPICMRCNHPLITE